MLYDTHCHLNMVRDLSERMQLSKDATDDFIKPIIERAKQFDVAYIMQAGTFLKEIDREIDICKKFSDENLNIVCSLANHPENVLKNGVASVEELVKIAKSSSYIKAIGETGLDTHKQENYDFLNQQIKSFENHIYTGIEMNLPIMIHAYGAEAIQRSIDIMISFAKNNNIKFLFHCYDGTYEQAKIIVDNGGIISFSGILTFKNKTSSKEILSKLPLDSIVVETDAPFLTPEPMRGKANETGFVKYTAEFASRYLNAAYDVFCNQTTQNALKLFNQL